MQTHKIKSVFVQKEQNLYLQWENWLNKEWQDRTYHFTFNLTPIFVISNLKFLIWLVILFMTAIFLCFSVIHTKFVFVQKPTSRMAKYSYSHYSYELDFHKVMIHNI